MVAPAERRERGIANVMAVDDAPFSPADERVTLVGAIYADERLDGVVTTWVTRDGEDATARIAAMLTRSRFAEHVRLVMLDGIAVAGFNVIDLERLCRTTGCPVVAVVRRRPDLDSIRDALIEHLPGGERRWRAIAALGPVEPVGEVFMQRAGIDRATAAATVQRHVRHGNAPEPLRVAHLIAGGLRPAAVAPRGVGK